MRRRNYSAKKVVIVKSPRHSIGVSNGRVKIVDHVAKLRPVITWEAFWSLVFYTMSIGYPMNRVDERIKLTEEVGVRLENVGCHLS